MQALLDGYVPFTGKTKEPAKKQPAAKKPPAAKKTAPKPVAKPEPIKLLKFTEKINEPQPTKPPTLSNKPLEQLYVKILSLKKRLTDNINANEKKVTETTLEKYLIAFRYVRTKFMNSIKAMSKAELQKLSKTLEEKFNDSTDKDANFVFDGQISEINKLL